VEPEDRLLLARTHELSGNIDAANEQYLAVAGRSDATAAHVAAYVDFLLRQESMRKNASLWIDRLEKMAPNDLATVARRARWLGLEGRRSEIGPLLEKTAAALKQKVGDDKQALVRLCFTVGAVYRLVKDYDGEQRWCRQLKDLLPEQYEPLAGALARQGRIDEAVALCLEAAKSGSPTRPALVLALVLTSGQSTQQQFAQAEAIFSKAIEADKDNVSLLNAVASVRIAQNRMDDAAGLLNRVIGFQPKNVQALKDYVQALNTLATVLGEQPGKTDEALRCVDQAMGIVGQQPGLLDTKAMILFYASRPKEAAELLEAAVLTPDADPRFFFHAAAAYDRLGEKDKAAKAFHRALAGNLDAQLLTGKDKELRDELRKKL
jgi:tetratricopeptide (TPR) repeat protein